MHLQPIFQDHEYVTVDAATDVGAEVFERGLCLASDVKDNEGRASKSYRYS